MSDVPTGEDEGEGERCGRCRHFVDDAQAFERALPGLLALGSGGGDCRGDQGLCKVHHRMLDATMRCKRFEPR